MKTLGLIGGMSWQSSKEYYDILNKEVNLKLGQSHSAKVILFSFDFEEIKQLQMNNEWEKATEIMIDVAKKLQTSGADALLICTNTMHKMAEEIESNTSIPLLHIADATATSIISQGIKKTALLGTKFTMEQDFYKQRILERFGIEVIIPDENDRQVIHDIIYNELCQGIILPDSKKQYLTIIDKLTSLGAESVILGCTEIGLLIKQDDCSVPVHDTTSIHAQYAIDFALQ